MDTAPHRYAGGTALVVEIPEAEQLIGDLRLRLDPAALAGVPAHVTVLFPFVDPDDIDDALITRLGAIFKECDPFDYSFNRIGWFGERVLWLAPTDPVGFDCLTNAVVNTFPTYQPYDGEFATTVPHLTVGNNQPYPDLQTAATELEPVLAGGAVILGRAEMVTLMSINDDGAWRREAMLPLGGAN